MRIDEYTVMLGLPRFGIFTAGKSEKWYCRGCRAESQWHSARGYAGREATVDFRSLVATAGRVTVSRTVRCEVSSVLLRGGVDRWFLPYILAENRGYMLFQQDLVVSQ